MNIETLIFFVAMNGLVLTAGYLIVTIAGHMSLALAASWCIPAYAYAVVALRTHSVTTALVCAVLAGITAALLQWLLSLRLHKLGFMIATLALQELVLAVIASAEFLGGRLGLVGFGTVSVSVLAPCACMLLAAAVAGCVILRRSKVGRDLAVIRQDALAAQSVGIRPSLLWLKVYVFAGVSLGLAGALYSMYSGAIMYTGFSIHQSILLLLAIIVARSAGPITPLVAAVFLVILPELLRVLPLGLERGEFARNIVFAMVAVGIICASRRGWIRAPWSSKQKG
ncbi:MAG: branched-chain amino acid ABC transporter permease [Kiritimatiellia bacterium]